MKLRDYQVELISKIRESMMAGNKTNLLVLPTGAGKTVIAAYMMKSASDKGMECLFLNHRREITKQTTAAFSKVGVRHGIIAAGFPADTTPKVQIGSVQTIVNRLGKIKQPRLIIWDEAHHLSAGSWRKIFRAYPDAFHVALTATPQRLDGQGLGEFFSTLIRGPEVEWLIENGFLSKYKIYAPPSVSMEGVHKRMGEFVTSEVTALFDKPTIVGDSVKQYKKHTPGKRAVVFAASIEHSQHLVAAFNSAGVTAAHVDGETPGDERDLKIEQFKKGEIQVISNVGLFGEGFDVPGIEVVIDVAPTCSLGAYLQRFGRALRPAEGKEIAVYLDQSGNVERHGLPDEIREWSLDGKADRKKTVNSVHIRICKKCFAAMKNTVTECQWCGYVFPIQAREIEMVEGDLVEIDPEQIRLSRKQEQGSAHDEASLIELGKKRGYKRPELWARHLMLARKRKK